MASAIRNMTPPPQSQTPTPTTSLTTSRSPSPKPRITPPPGLGNLGNTCYLNSVVQVLYHILPFRSALLSWTSNEPPSFASDLVESLRQVFQSLDRAQLAADTHSASYDLPRRSPSPSLPPPPSQKLRPPPSRTRTPPPSDRISARSHHTERPSTSLEPRLERVDTNTRSATHTEHDYEPDTLCDDDDGFLGDDEEELVETVLDTNAEPPPADGTREGMDFINPQNIIGLLRDERRCTEFDARGQQDAHEFLRFLLDKVNDCFQRYDQDHDASSADQSDLPCDSVGAPISVSTVTDASNSNDASASNDSPPSENNARGERSPASKRRRYHQDHDECDDAHRDKTDSDRPIEPVASASASASRETPTSTAGPPTAPAKRPRKRYRRELVKELFEGKAVTATRCDECECRTERSEQFLDVSLPVEAGKSLAWAWSSQGAREHLNGENKYSCENCHTYTEAQRWWQIAELPEVLTVHLKLFAFEAYPGAGGKVPVAMPCPVSMKLSEWCSPDCPERDDMYKLTAVIVHEGTGASSGHYYSYILKPDKGGWYIFDDNFVTPVTEAEMNERLFTAMRSRRTAYVLFYTHQQQS